MNPVMPANRGRTSDMNEPDGDIAMQHCKVGDMTEHAQNNDENQTQPADNAPQHTENGFGTYEWDPDCGIVFRMDLDQFGTIGGVPVSHYTPPPPAPYTPLNLS